MDPKRIAAMLWREVAYWAEQAQEAATPEDRADALDIMREFEALAKAEEAKLS